MSTRSLVLLSFAAAAFTFSSSFSPCARADVPNPSSSSSGSTTGGTGGSKYAADCNVAAQSIAGTTCETCTTNCGSLGSDYNFVCDQSASTQVWCNGPARDVPSDQNVAGCSVSVPNGPLSGAALAGAVAAITGLFLRRRRAS